MSRKAAEGYSWADEDAPRTTAQTGGDKYFYNLGLDGYEQNYSSISAAAPGLVDSWQNGGFSRQYIRLIGTSTDWSALSDALKSEVNSRGIRCSWYIWCTSTESNSYFSAELTAS